MILKLKKPFLILILSSMMAIAGCRKKEESAPQPVSSTSSATSTTSTTSTGGSTTGSGPSVPCDLYKIVSADPDYIPHTKNNSWYYCAGGNMAGYSLTIIRDTLINNRQWMDLSYYTYSSHTLSNTVVMQWFINPLGEYYQVNFWASSHKDTVLMIKPDAVNGDTIFNNSRIKIVLIDNNETVEAIPGCYHIREIYPTMSGDHYFKKGLGELYFNGFFKMNSATIIH